MEEIFLKSWDRTEQFYQSHEPVAWSKANMLTLIAELRRRGYDRRLLSQRLPRHLGDSTALMLSPTGLSHHDAKLGIFLKKNGGMVLHYHDSKSVEIQTEVNSAEFTPELESLLERLLAHPID